jgi:hypothetical protein
VVVVGGIKPGFSAWSCAASLVGEKKILFGVKKEKKNLLALTTIGGDGDDGGRWDSCW